MCFGRIDALVWQQAKEFSDSGVQDASHLVVPLPSVAGMPQRRSDPNVGIDLPWGATVRMVEEQLVQRSCSERRGSEKQWPKHSHSQKWSWDHCHVKQDHIVCLLLPVRDHCVTTNARQISVWEDARSELTGRGTQLELQRAAAPY